MQLHHCGDGCCKTYPSETYFLALCLTDDGYVRPLFNPTNIGAQCMFLLAFHVQTWAKCGYIQVNVPYMGVVTQMVV